MATERDVEFLWRAIDLIVQAIDLIVQEIHTSQWFRDEWAQLVNEANRRSHDPQAD
jgi:hypothetical protein